MPLLRRGHDSRLRPAGGPVRQAVIFVSVLGPSSYTYAEATWSQELENWEVDGTEPRSENLGKSRTEGDPFTGRLWQEIDRAEAPPPRWWSSLLGPAPSRRSDRNFLARYRPSVSGRGFCCVHGCLLKKETIPLLTW